ncbi:MAG: hypothetical protein JNM14_07945 [Ferruginibacter sp.]|nr:hypothetical protein [Ferruginibacter sp.]
MKPLIAAFIFTLFFLNSFAQQPEINGDSVVLKFTVTTADNKNLETTVSFEDLLTNKIKKYKTDKDGKGICTLSTATNYRITIKESNDSYLYNIPDFAISQMILNFKFTIR